MGTPSTYLANGIHAHLDEDGAIVISQGQNAVRIDQWAWTALFEFAVQSWGTTGQKPVGPAVEGNLRVTDVPGLLVRFDIIENDQQTGYRIEQVPGAKEELPVKRAACIFAGLMQYCHDQLDTIMTGSAVRAAIEEVERMMAEKDAGSDGRLGTLDRPIPVAVGKMPGFCFADDCRIDQEGPGVLIRASLITDLYRCGVCDRYYLRVEPDLVDDQTSGTIRIHNPETGGENGD